MKKSIILLLAFMLGLPVKALTDEVQHVYSTWETMEMDKMASLWLIKRFVDTRAIFKFYPRDTLDMEGVSIDTPLSQFRRTHRSTTYETLLNADKITDPSLLYIGKIVRDIEINIWGKKVLPESQGIDLIMKGVIINQKPEECIEKGFLVLDALYKVLEVRK